MGWVKWAAPGTTRKNTILTQPSPRPIGSGPTRPDSSGRVWVETPTHSVDSDPTQLMGLTRSDPTNFRRPGPAPTGSRWPAIQLFC